MKNKLVAALLILMVFLNIFCPSVLGEATETGYRISGMVSKLQMITDKQVEEALSKFPDMKTHWSRSYVGKIALLDIVDGVPGKGFDPDGAVKVDEFLKLIICALGYRPGVGTEYWAEPYIQLAIENNLIKEGEFADYKRPITREEMARILVLATMLKEPAPEQSLDELCRLNIRDYTQIGDSFKQSVITAYRLGLINGTPEGVFNPKESLTRAESSVVILKNLDVSARTPFKPENGFAIKLSNPYTGENYVVCRPDKKEQIQTAYVIKNNLSKSKGWGYVGYNPGSQTIGSTFYDSEQRFKENNFDMHWDISIDLFFPELSYYIVVFQPQKIKALHRDVVVEIFNKIFGEDSSKAMEQFDKYIELGISNALTKNETFLFNNLEVYINKPENDEGFAISIYEKQE